MSGRKRVLISVYDKTRVLDLARKLVSLGYGVISSGGTSETLRKGGVPVDEVAHYTGSPEILEGRVKTLHAKIHGGILADLTKESHRADLTRSGIEPISLVVVNLYPFLEVASRPGATLEDVIEMIDIGGPALVRAAAKNYRNVGVIIDPADYEPVIRELRDTGGLREATRSALAAKAFAHTAAYDSAIRDDLARRFAVQTGRTGVPPAAASATRHGFPPRLALDLHLLQELRYGENPHQRGALYAEQGSGAASIAGARQIQGKELSYNNIVDLDAAWRLVLEFGAPAATIVKHNNPCGVALAPSLKEAFGKARTADPASAFGGIVGFNREVDAPAAAEIASVFLECVIAPGYAAEALAILSEKRALRVMEAGGSGELFHGFDLRRVTGGVLVQDWDRAMTDMTRARVVTRRLPSSEELSALDFAWRVARHVTSNAIVLADRDRTVGIGAGQMSRVDSVRLAASKALGSARGSVLASDAFFPFRDGLDEAARAGVVAVAQPGGSLKDEEVIAAADEHGMAMVFTGVRHFRH